MVARMEVTAKRRSALVTAALLLLALALTLYALLILEG